MKNANKKRFEAYSDNCYFKENNKADSHFKQLKHFPNALGYDAQSGGFIVIHYHHKAHALLNALSERHMKNILILK